jgi:3-oxoacyl-[acyl-carrier protein] reductase
MTMKLADKVAIVTGGGTGIGRAICLRFAREGAAVVINYFQSKHQAMEVAEKIDRLGGKAAAIQADVSRDPEARRLIEEGVAHFGRLDVLVNNAGWTKRVPHHDLEKLSEEILGKTLAVNVKAPIYCIRAAVPYLRSDSGGSIINITSNAAFVADGSSVIYCASKAALTSITKSLARALAPEIRVNAISPGFVDTGFAQIPEETREKLKGQFPLCRPINPEDIADAAVFLATDANATIGQTLLVDGGITAVGPKR